ncbi:dymeclin-like [Plakobranchus ocellatus]|uniref:Dymeclin n=1 Tax=Plakobranchus ocellatus TaxID=259542 RepID=A0AAV4DCD7_9GAST|nr:dymeclin-like [Plakobranchus ocellatus]
MGATSSSLSELSNNQYLRRLASTDAIDPMDPFWNQLLSFSFRIPVSSSDAKLLEESTESIARTFALNNCHTGNLGSLIHNFLIRASELKESAQCEDNIFIWQTYNALFIIRSLCKYFVESLSEELLLHQFDVLPPKPDGTPAEDTAEIGSQAEVFITALVELIVDVPVLNFTYALHLEALNTLLVLLSIQMYHVRPASQFAVYRMLMQGKCSIHAPMLMKALMWNYLNQEKCPPELYRGQGDDAGFIYNATAALASSLWSVVTLGMGGGGSSSGGKGQGSSGHEVSDTLLADQSLLVILVLASHCTGGGVDRGKPNIYRQALFSFTDSQDTAPSPPTVATAPTFKLDMGRLYTVLCSTLRDDQTTLLLYLLLHQNSAMRAYILSRTNIDQLVMPLLQILYHTQEKSSHHIYMGLIILLVLSEDRVFNKSVHDIIVKNVIWYKERQLTEISLGGLLILVVIRTIQFNMTRMRDKYLHTNCLAALANMSSEFTNLNSFVAQKIVHLFSQLCKRHSRLVDQIRASAMESQGQEGSEGGGQSEEEQRREEEQQDHLQDLSVLEEVLRMVLEVINSTLTSHLQHNPHLVYSILYNRELFATFRAHPTFQDILQNIDTVLNYFSTRLEPLGSNPSSKDVLQTIKEAGMTFKKDKLKKFPELKFKYVEEESPEEFFIPYVWSLVYHWSNLYFNPGRILLFSLNTGADPDLAKTN